MKPFAHRTGAVAAGLAALGALQTLAFVHTAAWPLPLLAVALWVAALDRAHSARQAALWGLAFGTGWLTAGTWWLFVSMHRYGQLPAPLAALAVLALSLALSGYLALAAALYRRWRRGGPADALLLAALWLGAELARGLLLTGFPWVASGYAQVDGPLAVLAPWVGVYGIGAAVALLGAWLVQGRWALASAAALAAAALAPAGDFTRPTGTLQVQLLQPNVAQDEKFATERMAGTLQWVTTRLLSTRAQLVVAPETAIPLLPDQLESFAPGSWAALRQRFAQGGQWALVGVPLGDFDRGYTNSVMGLGPGAAYRYDKSHLVPFGEFVPPGFRWFTEAMNIPLGDFERGAVVQPSFAVQGERAAPNICYEDLFGEELARRFGPGGDAPTLFVNLSNIGWFGDTVAVSQHLAISRMRTLELQRPMLRATNTGATAVVDHRGRVTARLPAFTEGVLEATVQGREGLTPFARWCGRFGLWPLVALVAIALLGFGLRRPSP